MVEEFIESIVREFQMNDISLVS